MTATAARFPESAEAYRAARLRKKLSQERLAGEARVSRRHIIRIESGEYVPRESTRLKIAEALGVDAHSLPAREAVVPPFQTPSSKRSPKR